MHTVFIPGFAARVDYMVPGSTYHAVYRQCVQKGHTFSMLTLPNAHAGSVDLGNATMDQLLVHTIRLYNQIVCEAGVGCVLVGHSMGGRLAFHAACSGALRVPPQRVVLVCPMFALPPLSWRDHILHLATSVYWPERLPGMPIPVARPSALYDGSLSLCPSTKLHLPNSSIVACGQSMLWSVTPSMRMPVRLHCPITIYHSTGDTVAPCDGSRRVQERFKDLVVLHELGCDYHEPFDAFDVLGP